MDSERARLYCLSLPHVVETEQWGGVLFWVGDKAIGGKMFAMVNLESGEERPISYPADPERFAELVELEGVMPAPYLARLYWVSARWDVFRNAEWEAELHAAHELTLKKLTAQTLRTLALPKQEQMAAVAARRKILSARDAAKKARLAK